MRARTVRSQCVTVGGTGRTCALSVSQLGPVLVLVLCAVTWTSDSSRAAGAAGSS